MLVGVFFAALFLVGSVFTEDVVSVTISDGESLYELTTTCDTVSEALAQAGIEIGTEDKLNCLMTDSLANVDYIEITRPIYADVTVDDAQNLLTYSGAISDVCEDDGEFLDPDGLVNDSGIDEEIKEDNTVADDSQDIQPGSDTDSQESVENDASAEKDDSCATSEEEITLAIPVPVVEESFAYDYDIIEYEVEYVEDSSMYAGEEKVITKGSEGEIAYKFSVKTVDGVEVERVFIGEEITKEPVTEVIAYGTKATMETSRGNVAYTNVISVNATAYTVSNDGWGDLLSTTSQTGLRARWGVIAVDPDVIPLGTKVYIKSLDGSADYGFAIAADTGGSIVGDKIDLWMGDSSTCYRWGYRSVEVYILEDQSVDIFELRNGSVWSAD